MILRRTRVKHVIVLLVSTGILSLLCFPGTQNGFEETAIRIAGQVFIKNNAYELLRFLSDEIGPRLTGSVSARKAAEFCIAKFNQYGLANVHLEYFDAVGWLPGITSAALLEPLSKALVVDSMGLSVNTPEDGLIAGLIDVGHGAKSEFRTFGPEIKDKVVLCGAAEPPPGEMSTKELEKIAMAAAHGASACLIISHYRGKLTRTRTSNDADYSPIPAAGITYEDGTWLRRLSKTGKTLKIRLNIQNRILDSLQAENIIADIPGTEYPEEMAVLGAHLDTWDLGPGASDNGLGTAIVLESARILSSLASKPKRTVRFVLFTGEEQGLVGSKAFVEQHESELDRISLMVNLDITGAMYPGFLNPYGAWKPGEKLRNLLDVLKGFGIDRIEQRYPFDSDDFNFVVKGVPAMGLQGRGERPLTYAHTYADTFDKIEMDRLNLTTAAVAILVYYAAASPEPIAKRIPKEDVISFFRERGLMDRLSDYE